MKNYEKYADEIRELKSYIGIEWCELFAKPKVLKPLGRKCEEVSCGLCNTLTTLWLLEEYEEPKKPETDWSKVEVDTPILVRDDRATASWFRRYFAKFEDGVVYAWIDGKTSWTTLDDRGVVGWKYAKLADGEKECKEPETDWSKVEVDTPILVRTVEGADWVKRSFAKYEGGMVYVWNNGKTSWTALDNECVTPWQYAKLAESEEE